MILSIFYFFDIAISNITPPPRVISRLIIRYSIIGEYVSKAFKGSMEADIQKDTANLRNAANKKGRMTFIIERV